MSGVKVRREAIRAINNYKPISEPLSFKDIDISELYGVNCFSDSEMKKRLPKAIYKSVKKTIEMGEPLDASVADVVASAMKDWAISKGATHYCHVFYPLTGATAEKHDSFIDVDGDKVVTEFSGKTLIQGEPDASSFPNGGIRTTFEARGYTAWDVTSPAFVKESRNGTFLCIPTAFISWTGEALDKKTPLLRSNQALNASAQRMLRLFGHDDVAMVNSNGGPEQEYFLIDRNFYFARPDLISTGRTLFGCKPPKGQEFDDHYFGAIPRRVLAFMLEVERDLYKLGIPVKTRHNEVAPGQFEIAPIFETANIASDHNQMIMTTLKTVAKKYGMACLMHEKPFAGINGSGKHVNWSVSNATQGNLMDPGETPHENAQFIVFCAAVIRGVSKHAELLRAVVASASNDHRLGANEAPPAIISIFLGEQLAKVFECIKEGADHADSSKEKLTVGVDTLPPLPRDAGDRNRTSPFAFTGNRFEFRAVGSNQSITGPLVALNTALAESLDYMSDRIEEITGGDSEKFNEAIQVVVRDILEEHGNVIFNGDGYADEWQVEAAKRGLSNLKTTVDALPAITADSTVELFENYKVFSRRELESREEIYLEQFATSIAVEAKCMVKMAKTIIFPAAVRYQSELAGTCANMQAIGYDFNVTSLDELTENLRTLQATANKLQEMIDNAEGDSVLAEAKYMQDVIIPTMAELREAGDALESIVADDLWALPNYQEMLFIK
ncbi:MAG: glutamine synthetase III [Desulfovibrio sp.]